MKRINHLLPRRLFSSLTGLLFGGVVLFTACDDDIFTPTTSDELEIIELANRFENTFDRGDIDAHMATWADGASFVSPFGNYELPGPYRQWVQGFYNETSAFGTRHLITNNEVQVSGDRATMTCYLTILNQTDRSILATTVFNDSLARIDGQWKFTYRELTVDQEDLGF